jgi:arylsulfatase A-like enzyme
VAYTLQDCKLCRAKGAPALLNSSRVPCEGCVSGFLHLLPPPPPPAPRPAALRNILFMVIDDLRPQMSPYGQAETVTPHLAAFSKQALVFDRAYCQQAVCSPSRNSFLSGRRPDTTKAWNFKTHFRVVGPTWTTMPEYFLKAGWFVAGTGKVYHPGLPPNNDPQSWGQPYDNKGQQNVNCPPCPTDAAWCGNSWCSLNFTQNAGNNDVWIASDGQRLLTLAAAQPKPFFVAVGLHKPHTPYAYPAEIDAVYPPAAEIALPTAAARRVPVGMPDVAWEHCSAIKPFNESTFMPDLQAQQHRRAYYAAVTHTDRLIGDTLGKLASLKLAASTVTVVIGDHGCE